jgi:hypothetical protein
MARGQARLYRDDELEVLWLVAGRHELALSSEGVWVRAGRRSADLPWSQLEQVQQSGLRRERCRIELFAVGGASYALGPFPSRFAEQWLRAAGDAAHRAGRGPLPIEGGVGFALPGPPAFAPERPVD